MFVSEVVLLISSTNYDLCPKLVTLGRTSTWTENLISIYLTVCFFFICLCFPEYNFLVGIFQAVQELARGES